MRKLVVNVMRFFVYEASILHVGTQGHKVLCVPTMK
jgi:hypothetical protein